MKYVRKKVKDMEYIFKMLEGECWWGGTSADGVYVPFDKRTVHSCDFRILSENQTMPMFLSNKGRCIWSEEPFKVSIQNGEFRIEGTEVVIETYGNTLRDAYIGAQKMHFPICGDELPEEFFKKPQYSTWMQYTYEQTQENVLKYAHGIIDNGFAPGIFIIDEGWQKDYGTWEFNPLSFPNPKKMMDELHDMGFIVMLWVVPYVRADGREFVEQTMQFTNPKLYDKVFLRTDDGEIAITDWWDGYSACFDMTKKCDREMLDSQLTVLMRDFNVDGFKFDGGCYDHYCEHKIINGKPDKVYSAAERNAAWNEFGTRYRYHEYKDTFKGGGRRVIQRLSDRNHSWDNVGLNTLIPNAIQQGLLGHPFICPDMIGGGQWAERDKAIDQELFVRMAQCSALFPMMQFSRAPWEAVNGEYFIHVKAAHDLHNAFADTMLQLVNNAYSTGEPILRSLAYNYPDCGYEYVADEFMLGDDILVAPVIKKGEILKKIILPNGTWTDAYGREYIGGGIIEVDVDISSIPYFIKKN